MTDKQNRTLPAQPALCRILDANLDRAREGLRIIEEWCRFGINSADLAGKCKQLRQELAVWHVAELRSARDTPADPGTELTHPQEEVRSSIQHLLEANFCRVEEALRVLEEYGKIYDRNMGAAFKQMRYRVYTLESNFDSASSVSSDGKLPVPGRNIPIGRGGYVPADLGGNPVADSGGNSLPDARESSRAGDRAKALGFRYRVVVDAESQDARQKMQSLVPDAFRTFSNGRSVIQAGAFQEREKAEELAQMLAQNGFNVRIEDIK